MAALQCQDASTAVQLFESLKADGLSPDVVTYSSLLAALQGPPPQLATARKVRAGFAVPLLQAPAVDIQNGAAPRGHQQQHSAALRSLVTPSSRAARTLHAFWSSVIRLYLAATTTTACCTRAVLPAFA